MRGLLFAALVCFSVTSFSAQRKLEQTMLRTHVLVTPDAPITSPRPLLVLLHGCKINAQDIIDISEVEKYVDRDQFTVLAPDQSRLFNLDRCWNFFESSNQRPVKKGAGIDLTMISDLVTKTIEESNGTIDPNQIYIGGISSGAAMALNVFLCDSRQYRGLAMHSGIAFGVADIFNAQDLLEHGSGLSPEELRAKLKRCPKKNLATAHIIAFHGDQDTRLYPINFTELKEQIAPTCESTLSTSNRDFRLIKGLAHKWSGSQFPSKYSDPNSPSFTEAMLHDFGIQP